MRVPEARRRRQRGFAQKNRVQTQAAEIGHRHRTTTRPTLPHHSSSRYPAQEGRLDTDRKEVPRRKVSRALKFQPSNVSLPVTSGSSF
jgi:hypothetical protein